MLVCSDVLVVLLGCALICTAFILFSFNLAIYPPLGPSPPPPRVGNVYWWVGSLSSEYFDETQASDV